MTASIRRRLHKTTGEVTHTLKLLDAGLTSAHDISRVRDDVLEKAGVSAADAKDIRKRANARRDGAVWIWRKWTKGFDPKASPNTVGVSLCECEECASLLSPAAYLVELLSFTERNDNLIDHLYRLGGDTVVRRADLGEIQLTCANTNRLLPQIDLANELLENAIASSSAVVSYQTTLDDKTLELAPEHRNQTVYDSTLSSAKHPWSPSLNVLAAEYDAWLTAIGTSRRELAELLDDSSADWIILGLDATDREIARTPDTSAASLATSEYFGLSGTLALPDPLHPGTLLTDWQKALARAKYFFSQTGLSQEEFFALRATLPLAGIGGKLPDGACGLETTSLSGLDFATLARVVRFVRVLRRTGLSIPELDAFCRRHAATAVFEESALKELAALFRLRERTGRSFVEVLSWTDLPDTTSLTSPELTSLCRAFGLSIADFSNLSQVPFNRSAISLEELLETITLLRQSSMTTAEVKFLLGNDPSNSEGLAVDLNSESVFFDALKAAREANADTSATVAAAFQLPQKSAVALASATFFAEPFDDTTWKSDYQKFAKIALVAKRLQLSSEALVAWVEDHHPSTWPPIGEAATLPGLVELLRLASLRSWVLPGRPSLFALAGGENDPSSTALALLVGVDNLPAAVTDGLDLRTGRGLATARRRFDVTQRTGVDCAKLLAWASAPLTTATLEQIVRAAQAHVGIDAWPSAARPIANRLRERRRDALVGYLCSREHLTPAQLSARLLIDVEMSACQMTTRIRQALNSTQLYLQGVTLGLELDNPAETDPTKIVGLKMEKQEYETEWRTWLSSYTTWRLARDTFLFPENYFDAATRSSTTPLFANFDKRLQQSDVTSSAVEDAFGSYVRELDEIAMLEPLSLVHDNPAEGNRTTHVIARTRGAAPRYYYRTQINLHRFTPWQKLDLDIQGDHVFPALHEGTLYLFWATFDDKQDALPDNKKPDGKSMPSEPNHHFEVTLAWSELKAGAWSPKRLAKDKLKLLSEIPPIAGTEKEWTFEVRTVGEIFDQIKKDRPSDAYAEDLIVFCRHLECSGPEEVGWWILSPCSGNSEVVAVGVDTVEATRKINTNPAVPLHPNRSWLRGIQFVVEGNGAPQQLLLAPIEKTPQPALVAHSVRAPWPNPQLQPRPFVLDDGRRSYIVNDASKYTVEEKILAISDASDPGFELADSLVDDVPASTSPALAVATAKPFYHPFTCAFVQAYGKGDSAAVFDKAAALPPQDGFGAYFTLTSSQTVLTEPLPAVELEFGPNDAYSDYNWELLFFAPLRAADLLTQSGRFEDALRWMHRIYDPRIAGASLTPKLAWRFLPFVNRDETLLVELLALTDYSGDDPSVTAARELMKTSIDDWRKNPFDPYEIGRHRISAFMRFVQQRYVELLIAYGDSFFTDDTIEGLSRATQLYQWALAVLGERPAVHPRRESAVAKTYEELKVSKLDPLGNALVEIVGTENYVPVSGVGSVITLPLHHAAYFCPPLNAQHLALWDKVEDRLWKARHCQNLAGAERILALFGGTLDAAIFAEANRLGLDLGELASAPAWSPPIYRFTVVLQKAVELANELRSFGASLLTVAEKRDAETLALLRQKHERDILAAVRDVKQQMLDEAKGNRDALQSARELAEERADYYDSREYESQAEKTQNKQALLSARLHAVAVAHDQIAAVLAWIPNIQTGIQGVGASPTLTLTMGGSSFSQAMSATASALRSMSGQFATEASLSATRAAYDRRKDDWDFQKRLADKEIAQIDRQLAVAELRIAIATKELANHDKQTKQAAEMDKALREKLAPFELYDRNWQALGALYDQLATIARAAAYRAQDSYQYERAADSASFIEGDKQVGFGARLVIGDRLAVALRRMEAAYLDSNQRKQELTRHVSLALDFPEAFLKLRETGSSEVTLDEAFFDVDLPGQYLRRLRSAALTIACPLGPYQPMHAKLSLLDSSYRRSALASDYSKPVSKIGPVTLSRGLEDSGMFELNLRDERLLWFEGAGAQATYRVEIATGNVDLSQLTDVVLHLRYEATDDGTSALPTTSTKTGARFFAARGDFSDAWELFMEGVPSTRTIKLQLTPERFPFAARRGAITGLVVYWKGANGSGIEVGVKGQTTTAKLESSATIAGLFEAALDVPDSFGAVELTFAASALPDDLGLIVSYGPKV